MLPLSAPSCALDTKSWRSLVGRNSLPNGPAPCAATGGSGAARTWMGSITIEEHIANHGSAREREGRILHRAKVTVVEPGPGVAADEPIVTNEDQIIVDGNGDRLGSAGRDRLSSTRRSEPSWRMRSTEIWPLPASAARRKRPSLDAWSAPCEPMLAPVPAPPPPTPG
jgi:hypothetical protein